MHTSPAEESSWSANKSLRSLPSGTWHTLKDKLVSTSKSFAHKDSQSNDGPSIYSPRIRLTYTPPTPLPSPFPRTLHVDGLHLYLASSIFVRHTLNALYTDLRVQLKRVRVNSSDRKDCGASGAFEPGELHLTHSRTYLLGSVLSQHLGSSSDVSSRRSREKSITFGIGVTGMGRVSGAPAEWEV